MFSLLVLCEHNLTVRFIVIGFLAVFNWLLFHLGNLRSNNKAYVFYNEEIRLSVRSVELSFKDSYSLRCWGALTFHLTTFMSPKVTCSPTFTSYLQLYIFSLTSMLKEMLVITVTTLQHSKCTENINLYNVETFQ